MDFSLEPDQLALQDAVRRFCADRSPHPVDWPALAGMGLTGLALPEDVGGSALGAVDAMLVAEELGRAGSASAFIESALLCGRLVDLLASPAQRQRWLPPLVAGQSFIALAGDEAFAHRAAPQGVRASPGTDGWRLDGRWPQVAHADVADRLLVLARADDARPPLLLVVPAQAPGLQLRHATALDGHGVASATFDAVVVPAADAIVAPDQVDAALELARDGARAALCAESVGILSRLLTCCVEQLRNRRQFGRPLADFQALQHTLADLFIAVEQARSMAALAAMAMEASDPAERRRLVSGARVAIIEASQHVGEWSVQLHGAMGMTEEGPVAKGLRRLLVAAARHGTARDHLHRYAANAAADPPDPR